MLPHLYLFLSEIEINIVVYVYTNYIKFPLLLQIQYITEQLFRE